MLIISLYGEKYKPLTYTILVQIDSIPKCKRLLHKDNRRKCEIKSLWPRDRGSVFEQNLKSTNYKSKKVVGFGHLNIKNFVQCSMSYMKLIKRCEVEKDICNV